ncbi:MAG TPA: ATP-binding cassette domain-containing protein [Myxococcota bacterium]|nr:ATP-binding cassette domain-containing protein [Myxococcota bacterium]
MGALVTVSRASLGYPGRVLLRDVSLEVRPAEFVAVLGANGSGKTTLLRSLLGFLPPLAGAVEPVPGLRIGYVPQRETLDDLYPLTARDVALMGSYGDVPFWRRLGSRERARARGALEACDALGFARTRYSQLSGGQRQRVLIARALATEPQLLALDEPMSGVDRATEQAILAVLARMRAERSIAIWMITHHAEAVRDAVDRMLLVEDGALREVDGP